MYDVYDVSFIRWGFYRGVFFACLFLFLFFSVGRPWAEMQTISYDCCVTIQSTSYHNNSGGGRRGGGRCTHGLRPWAEWKQSVVTVTITQPISTVRPKLMESMTSVSHPCDVLSVAIVSCCCVCRVRSALVERKAGDGDGDGYGGRRGGRRRRGSGSG